MLEHILYGFGQLLDLRIIFWIVISVIGGSIVGAMPGISPTMAVALVVPFTFVMNPVEGLLVLGGIFVGGVYGGSISAILLNIPGAPANIATIIDGYPMAKKGQARRALVASAIASAHGGMVGALGLMLFAPLLAAFALGFGTAEIFWAAIFGLVIIASLGTGKELIKGLLSGGFGVWLGIIGTSPTTGDGRFTFGLDALWGGISLVPAMVGFFAFAQVMVYFEDVMRKGEQQAIQAQSQKGDVWAIYKEMWKKLKSVQLIGAIVGLITGLMPGVGGQVGGIVAYDQVKRYSKNPEEFGKGRIEGVVAPEFANSTTVGMSLVPTFTLGIPGSPTAAVLLGGLLIHGLWPGPTLFTENADIAYTFMAGFFVSQIVILLAAILILKYAAHILKVKEYYMGPTIIALCFFGAFAVNNNFFDVYVMLALGVIGYFLLKIGITPIAAVLGLVLGAIAEQNFLLGYRIASARDMVFEFFFMRPISMVIIGCIILLIASTIWMERNRMIKEAKMKKENPEIDSGPKYKGIFSVDAIIGMVVVAVSIGVWQLYLVNLPREAAMFPIAAFQMIAVVGVVQIIYATKIQSDRVGWIPWRIIAEVSVASIIAASIINFVGFYTTVFFLMVFVGARMVAASGKNTMQYLPKIILFSIGAITFLYLAFGVLLFLPTPRGILF